MNHIAQYRNGLHHQIHHNPCPPLHNFSGRFPTPNLGHLSDNVMLPQIVTEGGIQYHNGPLQPFISTPESRPPQQQQQQQQSDDGTKVQNHRKPTMTLRTFQPVPAPIISTPNCSTQQETHTKAPETGSCNDNNYKPPQNNTVDNHPYVQHCDQGAKNCVQCYNLIKGEPSGPVVKIMVDAATMTDQDEMDQTGNWSVVSNSSPPPTTKVTEYLSSLRQFLKVDQKPHESKKQRQGDVRIVTSLDGTRLYFCPECNAAYPDKNLLEPHLAAHKIERRFICNVCGAGLKRKEHLDRHQLSHSEERPYSCGVCSKTFKRNEHLSRHSIIHSGLKAQVCTECGKGFYRSDHLRKHLLGHRFQRHKQKQKQPQNGVAAPNDPDPFMEKERPWVCGVCGAAHIRKEHLDRHQLTHTDERPYACPLCPKAFKHNEHLSRHLVIHSGHKTQVCTECGKMFYRKDHLRKHSESHRNKRLKQEHTISTTVMDGGNGDAIVQSESLGKVSKEEDPLLVDPLRKYSRGAEGLIKPLEKFSRISEGPVDPLSKFPRGTEGSADPLGKFSREHEEQVDHLAKFSRENEGQVDQLGHFSRVSEGSVEQLGKFSRGPEESDDHLGKFSRDPEGSVDPLGKFPREHEGQVDPLGHFPRVLEGPVEQLNKFSRGPEGQVDLLGKFSRGPEAPIDHLGKYSRELENPIPKFSRDVVGSVHHLVKFSRGPEGSLDLLAKYPRGPEESLDNLKFSRGQVEPESHGKFLFSKQNVC